MTSSGFRSVRRLMVDRIIPRRRENMRFRVRTMMVAVVILGLVMALTVLSWRAREDISVENSRTEADMKVAFRDCVAALALILGGSCGLIAPIVWDRQGRARDDVWLKAKSGDFGVR